MNGVERTLDFDEARIGKNEVSLAQHGIFSKEQYYTDVAARTGNEHYFVVHRPGETIDLTVGEIDDDEQHNYFAVSNEVSKTWDQLRVMHIALDPVLKPVIIKKSPPFRLARGVEKTIEDSLTISHQVEISNHWKAGAELRADVLAIWGQIGASVKVEVEHATSHSYFTTKTRRRSVTIKGENRPLRVRVLWIEYFRTGKATIRFHDRTMTVPFQIADDFDLSTETAK